MPHFNIAIISIIIITELAIVGVLKAMSLTWRHLEDRMACP